MIWLGNRTRLSIQSVYRIEWKSHSFVFLVCTFTWLPISRLLLHRLDPSSTPSPRDRDTAHSIRDSSSNMRRAHSRRRLHRPRDRCPFPGEGARCSPYRCWGRIGCAWAGGLVVCGGGVYICAGDPPLKAHSERGDTLHTDFSTALRGRQRCTAFRRTPPTGSACSSPPRSAPSNPPPRPSGPATTSLHSSAANSAPATHTHRVPCSRPCPQTHCTPSPAHTSPRATTRRIPCP